MEDDACLAAIVDGDIAALEQLYVELRVPVFAAALAISGDRSVAEDVLQETFVRVYSHAHTFRPGSAARAWVVTIARNLAFDALRRRAREVASGRPDGRVDARASPLELIETLLELEPAERQIVALHDVAGLTHAEIARELGLPAGTVRWKYRVALGRLRARMEEKPDD